MPVRFRRTFKIFPGVKINVSKSGISTTIGPRGFHLTFNRHGVRQSVGLPGTGLSETSYLVKHDDDDDGKEKDKDSEDRRVRKRDTDDDDDGVGCFPWGCLIFLLIAGVIAYYGANAMGWLPPNYLSHLLQQFTQWVQGAGF